MSVSFVAVWLAFASPMAVPTPTPVPAVKCCGELQGDGHGADRRRHHAGVVFLPEDLPVCG